MSDLLREIEENIKSVRTEALVRRLAPVFVSISVIAVCAVGGVALYKNYKNSAYAKAGDDYNSAVSMLAEKPDDAKAKLEKLSSSGKGGYSALAAFTLAREEYNKGDADKARKVLEHAAAKNASAEIRRMAVGSASLLGAGNDTKEWLMLDAEATRLIDNKKYAEALKLLESDKAAKADGALQERLKVLKQYAATKVEK